MSREFIYVVYVAHFVRGVAAFIEASHLYSWDISNYGSLDFIGVSLRTSVSMALHFHMQKPHIYPSSHAPPAHPPPSCIKSAFVCCSLVGAPCEPQARMRWVRGGWRGKGRRGWWWSSSSAVDTLRPLLARLPSCTVGNKLLGSRPPNRAAINGKLSGRIDIPGS